MAMPASTVIEPAKLAVRRNLRAVRDLLQRVRQSVRQADSSLFGRPSQDRMLEYVERRGRGRSATTTPIYVTPAVFDGRDVEPLEAGACGMLAVTNDVSLRGVGFTHDEPFEADYAIVTFDLMDGPSVTLLLEVRWANLKRGYSYMSGDRFLGITETADV